MDSKPISCPICSSSKLESKPFGYQFNSRWLGAWECKNCKIIFISPQPTKEELELLYDEKYFEKDYRCGHEESYFEESSLSKLSDDKLFDNIKLYKEFGKFLEIGSAGGALLNAARKAGFDVTGIEFSAAAAKFARDKFNLNVIVGDIATVNLLSEEYDIVFMGDVLEHLPNPNESLRRINKFMKKDGLLIIRCPLQTNTLFSRIGFCVYKFFNKRVTVQLPPYHLFEYRKESIKNLLNYHGFEIIFAKESIMSPSEISLRGPLVQKIFKKLFHYFNYILTKTLKIFGDRIEVYAMKRTESKI